MLAGRAPLAHRLGGPAWGGPALGPNTAVWDGLEGPTLGPNTGLLRP